jgi:hypothetical protein
MELPAAEADDQKLTLAAIRPLLGAKTDELILEGRTARADEMVAEALELTR